MVHKLKAIICNRL